MARTGTVLIGIIGTVLALDRATGHEIWRSKLHGIGSGKSGLAYRWAGFRGRAADTTIRAARAITPVQPNQSPKRV